MGAAGRGHRNVALGLVFCLALTSVVGLAAAAGSAGLKVSDSDNVSAESAIAIGPDELAIAWSGSYVSRGIYLAHGSGHDWVQSTLVIPTTGRAWNPSIAYDGSALIAAWTQGEAEFPRNTARSVVQLDVGSSGSGQTLMADVYGDVAPDLAIADNGMHMVFAAATSGSSALNAEVYYTHRPVGSVTWSPPAKIAGFSGVPSPLDGMWQPRIATNAAGTTIHVVWERTAGISGLSYSAWYMQGSWGSGILGWAPPQQVSPGDQQYAMRPDVAVDEGDQVHIVWTEVIPTAQGSILPAEAQHINYWRPGLAGTRVNKAAIKVNSTEPTWASASVAAGDAIVCIGWHGYAPDDLTSKEDVVLSCSRDGGQAWSPPRDLSRSDDWLSLFPMIALDSEGLVHASWVEEALIGVEFLPVGIYYGFSDTRNTVFLPLVLR